MSHPSPQYVQKLVGLRDAAKREAEAAIRRAGAAGRRDLTAAEAEKVETYTQLSEHVKCLEEDVARSGIGNPLVERLRRANAMGSTAGSTEDWSRRVAQQIVGTGREQRAVSTGVLDVPSLVIPNVTEIPWPTRLVDLLSNRVGCDSNSVEYYVESARTNNAAVVADGATKPTSVFTVIPVQGHCRVVAHVSEPIPIRLLQDVPALQSWLVSEMASGVLSGLEHEAVLGIGSGESMTGIMSTPGTTSVSFSTDRVTSIRRGLTALQQLGEVPTAIALNPSDAEAIDLTRWGTDGGFLTGGFEFDRGNGFGTSDQIFGPSNQIRRVISPSVPSGWAILADWRQLKLFVREGMSIMLNFWSEDLFTKNQYVVRAEMRCLAAVVRPQSFAVIDLTAGS